MLLVTVLFSLCTIVAANTETYLLKIPHHFSIPHCPSKQVGVSPNFYHVNESHAILLDYPIGTIETNKMFNNVLEWNYNTIEKPIQNILVRINNYNDTTFESNDLLFVKLCWPATSPLSFEISHEYHKLSNFMSTEHVDSFDLYLKISIGASFHLIHPSMLNEVQRYKFLLDITKVPHKLLPVPVELYSYIFYALDLTIFLLLVGAFALYKLLFS